MTDVRVSTGDVNRLPSGHNLVCYYDIQEFMNKQIFESELSVNLNKNVFRNRFQRGPATAIKTESTNGDGSQANVVQISKVKYEPNNSIELNDVKIESKDKSKLDHVEIEPSNGASILNPVKIELHDGTSEPNHVEYEPNKYTNISRLNDNAPQTKNENNSPTQSPRAEDMGVSKLDHSLNTRNSTDTLHPISPEMRPSQGSPVSTPKKRRKKLNY